MEGKLENLYRLARRSLALLGGSTVKQRTPQSNIDELRILILHGLLHLAGMDHETDSGAMARAEVKWRKRLGLPTGLIERAHA